MNTTLSQLARQATHSRDWDRIDQHCKQALEMFREPGAKSLVRAGDGEWGDLRKQYAGKSVAYALAYALKHADCVGLADSYMPGGKTAIIKGLRNIYRMVLTSSLMVSVRLFRFVPGLIGQLAAGKRVLWITSNAHVIVDNLNNLDFKHFYGLHDIVHNASINAAPCKPCSGYPASISVDESYADIQEKLVKSEDFDIAFVEAGVTGKLVCHHIKANLDKTAIDIGFMTSALRGDRDHDALLPNKLMHSFVWDPSRS